jgi:hypothetical protein
MASSVDGIKSSQDVLRRLADDDEEDPRVRIAAKATLRHRYDEDVEVELS